MSLQIILKNSSVSGQEPTASQLANGELALNYHANGPFLTCKDTAGVVRRIAGVWISTTAPTSPQPGEFWLDTNTTPAKLKVYKDSTDTWIDTIPVPVASTTTAGIVELATNLETQTGADTLRAVTPASLQSKISDSTSTTSSTTIASSTAVKSVKDVADAALPAAGGTISGNLTVSGDLTVNGTTTTIDTTTLIVEDKNIEMGAVATPTDTTADGGGITLKGTTDKTLNWVNSTDSWTSSENVDLASGKTYKIAGTDVLSGTTLGSGVTGSSLTSVGTITSGTWNGTQIATNYIADGAVTSNKIADGTIVNADVNASAAIAGTKISPDFGSQTVETTGVIRHALGTAGAPTVTFTGDTNTGIYSPGADQVAISTNGTGRLFVDANGNVGVNTSFPLTNGYPAFTVSSNTQANLYFEDTGYESTGNGVGWFSWDNGALAFSAGSRSGTGTTGSSEYLRIDNSGRLGLGTSSPSRLLSLNQPGSTAGEYGMSIGQAAVSSNKLELTVDTANNIAKIHQTSILPLTFWTNGSHAVTIDSSQRVGIGTQAPAATLHVAGNTLTEGKIEVTSATPEILFSVPSGGLDSRIHNDGSGNFIFGTGTNSSTPTERVRIDSSGRVGIGTTDPSAAGASAYRDLVIAGTGNRGITIQCGSGNVAGTVFNTSNGGNAGGYIYDSSASQMLISAGGASGNIAFNTNNGERARIDNNGRLGLGTTSPADRLHIYEGSTNGAVIRLENTDGEAYLSANNDNLYIDANKHIFRTQPGTERARIDDSGRLLVGTSSARANLLNSTASPRVQVEGTSTDGGSLALITSFASATAGASPILNLCRAGSTALGSNTVVASNNYLGQLIFSGNDGSEFVSAASIDCQVDGTPGTNDMPGRLVFSTTADGAASPTERMRIDSNGDVGIGAISGTSARLHVRAANSDTIGELLRLEQLNAANTDGARLVIKADAANNTVIYDSTGTSSGAHVFQSGSTERARIDSSGRLLVGTSSTPVSSTVVLQGRSGATTGEAILRLCRGQDSPADGATLGDLSFGDSNNGDAARIFAQRDGGTWTSASSRPSRLVFSTAADGAASPTEALRITNDRVVAYNQPDVTSKSAAATLTIAELKTGIIQYTGAAATLTLPTGTLTEGGFSGIYTNMTFEWSVINTGSGTCTIGAGTAHTIVGGATIAAGASGRFASRRTAANTFVTYRLS